MNDLNNFYNAVLETYTQNIRYCDRKYCFFNILSKYICNFTQNEIVDFSCSNDFECAKKELNNINCDAISFCTIRVFYIAKRLHIPFKKILHFIDFTEDNSYSYCNLCFRYKEGNLREFIRLLQPAPLLEIE